MSHNYYLHRDGDACRTCGHERKHSVIHIGHSGGGWVFLWRGWRDQDESPFGIPVTMPSTWIAILREHIKQGAVIKSSNGEEVTLDTFLARVENKRTWRDAPARLHSALGGGSPDCVHVQGDDIAFYEFS